MPVQVDQITLVQVRVGRTCQLKSSQVMSGLVGPGQVSRPGQVGQIRLGHQERSV